MGTVSVHPVPLSRCPACPALKGISSWHVRKSRLCPGCRYSSWHLEHWIPMVGSQSFHLNSISLIKVEPGQLVKWAGMWGWLEDMPTGMWAPGGPWPGTLCLAAHGCSLVPAQHRCQHFQHVVGTWGWQGGTFNLSHGVQPWYPLLGDVWRAEWGEGGRKLTLTQSHLHTRSCKQRGWQRFPK